MWQVEYSDVAESDLLRLNKPERERILKFFRERVSNHQILSGWQKRFQAHYAVCGGFV